MRRFYQTVIASAVVLAAFALPAVARAQWGVQVFAGPGYAQGPVMGVRSHRHYFGNGAHDYQPHWHTTQTPYGPYSWYGNGPHDYVPHAHSRTPWSYRGYSQTQAGPTTSYYPPQPPYIAPW